MGFSALGLGCWIQKVSPPLLSGETGEMTDCFVSSSPQTLGHHLPKIRFLPTPSSILSSPTPEGQKSFQDSPSLSFPEAHGRGQSHPPGDHAQR